MPVFSAKQMEYFRHYECGICPVRFPQDPILSPMPLALYAKAPGRAHPWFWCWRMISVLTTPQLCISDATGTVLNQHLIAVAKSLEGSKFGTEL